MIDSTMLGNQQKMRKALELAITIGDWCCAQTDDPLECCEFSCAYQVEPHGEAGADCPWKKIRAALSAPARNCDLYETRHDMSMAYEAYRKSAMKRYGNGLAGRVPMVKQKPMTYDEWLLAPAAERKGEGDGR